MKKISLISYTILLIMVGLMLFLYMTHPQHKESGFIIFWLTKDLIKKDYIG
jgi:hypothetical protein